MTHSFPTRRSSDLLRYLRNYIVESYLVAAKVAEKLRYLQPAQIILSWSIRILLVWLILVAATMALVPAKGPSWTVLVSAVENVLGTPTSSPEAPKSAAHDDSAEKSRWPPATVQQWSSSMLTIRSEEPTSELQLLMPISYAVVHLYKTTTHMSIT